MLLLNFCKIFAISYHNSQWVWLSSVGVTVTQCQLSLEILGIVSVSRRPFFLKKTHVQSFILISVLFAALFTLETGKQMCRRNSLKNVKFDQLFWSRNVSYRICDAVSRVFGLYASIWNEETDFDKHPEVTAESTAWHECYLLVLTCEFVFQHVLELAEKIWKPLFSLLEKKTLHKINRSIQWPCKNKCKTCKFRVWK